MLYNLLGLNTYIHWRDTMEFLAVPVPEKVADFEKNGEFARAVAEIDLMLEYASSAMLRQRLLWEKERLKRIEENYTYSSQEALDLLSETFIDLSPEEFEDLKKNKKLDSIIIDGREFYEKRFDKNLMFLDNSYEARLKEKDTIRSKNKTLLHEQIDRLSRNRNPLKFKVQAGIYLRAKVGFQDETLRCWLPVPRVGDQIAAVTLLETSHERYSLAPLASPQRTIFFEAPAEEGTEFSVKFEYEISEISCSFDPYTAEDIDRSKFGNYLSERAPHIVFTPYLRNLALEIAGTERNPYFIAKRFYEWICENVRYSFMSEYALYDNLAEFAAVNLRGDCGVKALLFITLCRIMGIPARWQSGWYATPISASPHDWALFWVEPHGWVPVDCSFGGARKDMPIYRDFYFGNLDAFRMVSNSAFMSPLSPVKKFYRFDPYDNQVGEIETDKRMFRSSWLEHELKIYSFDRLEEKEL